MSAPEVNHEAEEESWRQARSRLYGIAFEAPEPRPVITGESGTGLIEARAEAAGILRRPAILEAIMATIREAGRPPRVIRLEPEIPEGRLRR